MLAALPSSAWLTDSPLCREIGALVALAEGQPAAAIAELRVVVEDQARVAVAPILGDPLLHLAYAYLQAGHSEQARAVAGHGLCKV